MIVHAQLNEHRQATYEKTFFKQMKTGYGLACNLIIITSFQYPFTSQLTTV